MTTIPHRYSISKRSSSQQVVPQQQQQQKQAQSVNSNRPGIKGKRLPRAVPNDLKTTLHRLEYLNNKFNLDPSFDIEVSGDDDYDDVKEGKECEGENGRDDHQQDKDSSIDVYFNSKLMEIDIASKAKNVYEMENTLESSISLLTPLFQYIQDFEANLNTLSNEMEILQTRLVDLNNEIQENSKIDIKLTPILNDLLIAPKCIKTLLNGKIDEKWVEQLIILQEKRELLQNYENNEQFNHANIVELVSLINRLEIKCVERIKRFLIECIKQLRGTNTSSVKIQSKLLQVKEIFGFLKNKNSSLAKEFETAYIFTIRWYYYFNFVKYISSLETLKISESEYEVDRRRKGSIANNVSSSMSNNGQNSLLLNNGDSINEYLINLPKRLENMNDVNNQYSILAQIAESSEGSGYSGNGNGNGNGSGMKFYMEQIFQFLNQTMIDNLTIEFNFIVEFFILTNNDSINNLVKQIFNPILKLGSNFTNYLLENCKSDYFGILLTIRRIQRMEYEIQNRCLPELFENYLNAQLLTLWPVFQRDIDVLCASITQTMGSTSVIKSVVNSRNNILIPLKITQSFSIVLSNLLKLVQSLVFELETSEPLNSSIERLSSTYERGLVQLAGSLEEGRGKRRLFLYVNFQLVASVLESGGAEHSALREHYRGLVAAYS